MPNDSNYRKKKIFFFNRTATAAIYRGRRPAFLFFLNISFGTSDISRYKFEFSIAMATEPIVEI